MSTASIIFYPRVDKQNKKTKKVPIYLRILLNRTKCETRLPLDVSENDFKKWDPVVMRFSDPKMIINDLISKYQMDFQQLIYRNNSRINELNATDLRDMLFGKKSTAENTAIAFINDYYYTTISHFYFTITN